MRPSVNHSHSSFTASAGPNIKRSSSGLQSDFTQLNNAWIGSYRKHQDLNARQHTSSPHNSFTHELTNCLTQSQKKIKSMEKAQ